ncbi:ABC transporter ATP-binding protein [Actinophytocola sp.]|uniref:ABC transporter ATP-binding protein n=1 Tax=Actinophytocola sp. TaxID=1872138 RepID=UPI00389AC401
MTETDLLLRADGLCRSFDGVFAVRDVDLHVAQGELRAVIGPNGAGKSTLFGLIGGQLRADAGTVTYDGARIDRLPPQRRARAGIAVVFQGARVFAGMTVLENVMVGAHASTGAGFVSAVTRLGRHRRDERAIVDSARECLARTGLLDWADRPAEALPLGQQRVLQVARALCGRPRLLLLDEPASGLRAAERQRLASLLADLKAEGRTMLLVEHDVAFVTRLADRITVLDLGQVIAEGTPAQIRADEKVVAAYLGTEVPA